MSSPPPTPAARPSRATWRNLCFTRQPIHSTNRIRNRARAIGGGVCGSILKVLNAGPAAGAGAQRHVTVSSPCAASSGAAGGPGRGADGAGSAANSPSLVESTSSWISERENDGDRERDITEQASKK
ncbi:hypothetical protein BV22DRAFT_1041518 [Leucogyrophana mollusca]|uniref:Uncharacterized protein n=1 Tax=Leucogyrophana mollusca TaxID=85980 RepID=A0ACB8B1R1_9AGAM|nr:hypothetical protein BV22DRAFT_1041518 [Leucogyrophana mollusca]